MRQSVTIDEVVYDSRSDAAKALVAAGKPLAEVAKTVGMKYQTVYAVTKGAEKVAARRVNYRSISLAKTGRYTAHQISERVGISKAVLNKVLSDAGLTCPTAKELAAVQKAAQASVEPVKAEKKKAKRKTKKSTKTNKE